MKSEPCTNESLSVHERKILTTFRAEWTRDLWSGAIDGEYLDIRMVDNIGVLFDNDEQVGDRETYLTDGVYEFEFIGGYSDDWLDDFKWYARRTITNDLRGAVAVKIQAVVVGCVAKFAVLPVASTASSPATVPPRPPEQ